MIMNMGEAELKEYVDGFTGDTLFTEAVVAAVMANKFKLSAPGRIEAPARPACIDRFAGASKITDIQAISRGLSDEERSAAILYMVYDTTADYAAYIKEVVGTYGKNMLLDGGQQKLTAIINSGEFNKDAYAEIVASSTPIAESFKMIYGL